MHGYQVLPDRSLARDEDGYVAAVRQMLGRCKLSIHIVGTGYGAVPDGPSTKSVVELQNDLAIERSRSAGLRRIIWLREGTTSQHEGQQPFIAALHTDATAQLGADLITGDFETVKTTVHSTLRAIEKPEPAAITQGQADEEYKFVYIICDARDRSATIPLRKFLKKQGLNPELPVFEGDAAAVRQANQDLLARCEAVILFYGAGDEAWKHSVETDLRKMKAYRNGRPLPAIITYLAQPATADKNDLIELEEPDVVNGLDGFSEASLQPFFERVRS
jgi:hypothetical protein